MQLQEPEGNGTPSSKEDNHGSLKEGSKDIEEADHDCVDDSISNADSRTDDKNGDEEKSPLVAGDGDTAMHESGGPSPAVKATDDVQSTEAKETESMKANATEAGKEPATKAGKAPISEVGKANATEAVKGNATEEGKGNVLEAGKENTTEAAKPEKPKAPSTESGKPKATEDKKVAKKKIDVPVKKARVSRKDAQERKPEAPDKKGDSLEKKATSNHPSPPKPSPPKQTRIAKPESEVKSKAALPDSLLGQSRAALNLRMVPLENAKKKLLIFNVHGTLLDCNLHTDKHPNCRIRPTCMTKTRRIFLRPWLQPLLSWCFLNFTVGFWGSKSEAYMDNVVSTMSGRHSGGLLFKPFFVWSGKHCDAVEFEGDKPSS